MDHIRLSTYKDVSSFLDLTENKTALRWLAY